MRAATAPCLTVFIDFSVGLFVASSIGTSLMMNNNRRYSTVLVQLSTLPRFDDQRQYFQSLTNASGFDHRNPWLEQSTFDVGAEISQQRAIGASVWGDRRVETWFFSKLRRALAVAS